MKEVPMRLADTTGGVSLIVWTNSGLSAAVV